MTSKEKGNREGERDHIGGVGGAGEIRDPVVDGARVPGNALRLHEIPNPLPDPPLPRLRIALSLVLQRILSTVSGGGGGGGHGRARLGVEAEALGLESGGVEGRVVHSCSGARDRRGCAAERGDEGGGSGGRGKGDEGSGVRPREAVGESERHS